MWAFPQPERSPYDWEWDDLIAAIRDDKPYNEVKRGAEASLVASMGRFAAHTGQLVTFDQMMNHDHEFAPDVDKLTLDGPAPLRAGATVSIRCPNPESRRLGSIDAAHRGPPYLNPTLSQSFDASYTEPFAATRETLRRSAKFASGSPFTRIEVRPLAHLDRPRIAHPDPSHARKQSSRIESPPSESSRPPRTTPVRDAARTPLTPYRCREQSSPPPCAASRSSQRSLHASAHLLRRGIPAHTAKFHVQHEGGSA